ncbi:MAG TPA: amino acid adenylation domain-containing protein, partial [Burkholderiaceae bacterium]
MQFRADDNPDQASSPVSGETGNANGFVVAKGGVEARLAALWATLFKRKRVGRFDDFFELGGDSLLAAQLLARIQEAFSVEVAIDRLFVHRNVAALAGFIETIGKVGDVGQGAGATLLASSSVKTLSYSQQRLWFLAQLEGPNPTYNIARVVRLDGTPDIDIFRIALQALVDRHEALRTTFAVHDGKPTLQIHDQQVLLAVEDAADVARWEELCARESGYCFDLNGDCLYRLTLVKRSFVTSGKPYCLLATFHHSVFDGLSVSIFIRDLGALYGALSSNAQADLPQLPLQFSDYAAWQQKRLHNGEFKEYESYWRQQLAELPPCIDLPSDRPRPAERSHRGAAAEIRIGGLAASRLKDLARQHNATMYMVLLSAFAVLLGRYTNQNDIAIGSPVANRPHRDLENVIGFFVNTLVMRCRPSDQKTFVELIGETREVVLMALANQDIPFDLLVETIRPARSLNTTPLFQVMFALLNEDGLQGQGGGWAELEEPGRAQAQDSAGNGGEGVAHFDMTLLVKMLPEGLQCKLEYATDMFDAETVQGVLSSFKSLVESLGEQPSVPLSVFACVSEKDFQRQVQAWNQTTSSFDIDSCVHELFERRVDACPDAIALVFENQSISFHELNNRANWLARHLLDGGLELESHVGLFFERAIDMVVAILAVVKAGACYVPLDPWLPAERTQFILKDADVKWVLSNVALPDFMRSDTLRNVNVPQVLEQGGYDPLSRYPNIARNSIGLCPDNLVYWLYTSGTSGQPKGVMIRHSSLSNLCQDSILRRGFNGECRNLQFAPITFDAASAEIFNSLLSGSILHIPKVNVLTSAEEFSAYSKKHAINRGYIPPAFLPTLDSRDFSAYRSLSVGGEAIPKEIARQWSGVCKLTNAYGPTECTIACTSGTVDGLEDVSIGSFVANVNGYVMNDALQLVPVGVVGELCIGGECLARGYANDRRLTAEKFIPDPFSRQAGARLYRSGDLVRYRKDGKLEFVGRKDQQVKLRGFRIELGEIESCLMQYPGIKAAVASVQGNEENRKLVAHYLMHDDAAEEIAQEIDSHGLRAFAQQRLPAYMVPAGFARLAAFPLTANGKVDRKSLPAVKLESADGAGMLPIGEAEWRMAQLWSQLLQVEAVGRFDNFFELGGHSLLAAHLVSRVREAFGADVSVRDLFENQTLDRFTALVDAHQGDEGLVLPVLQICPRGESPLQLSPAQKRLWFLYKFMGKNAVFNIPLILQLKGKLDKEKLQAAVTKIIHRHEALRTRFVERDGDVLQMIDPPAPFVLLEETAHGEEELHALCHRESSTHFDLCSDALFRFCLIKLLDKDGRDGTGDAAVHVVHVTLHHILADGQSAAVLLQELAHFYNEDNGAAPLPPLPFQYGDYVAWQGDPGRTAQIEQQIDYWRNKLSGLPSSLELPFDFARPREQTFAGATRNVVIAPDISRQLRELGRQNGATFFMTLIAAFGVLLGRYSGQADFAVGTPISKREVPGSDRLIGLFLNLLVLRFNVDLGRSFTSLLQAAKDTAIDAYRHQDVPFESLVESLKPERSLGHTPFFQTSFTLVENPLEGIAFQDLDFSVLNIEEERGGVARYDLTFTLRVLPDGSVMCNMEYNTDLFLAQTIERMLTHFLRLLEAVVADPDCAVGRLIMLDETEQHRMLVEWNGTAQDYAGERTVHQLFEAQAAKTPDSAALVFEDQALTYAEVNARA